MAARRLAIVTGTSSGIGAALAAALLRAGWTVVGLARRPVKMTDDRYTHLSIDLGDLGQLPAFAAGKLAPLITGSPWHQVALINNAARLGSLCEVSALDPAEIAAVMNVNATAPIFLMGFAARTVPRTTLLQVVNISSGAAQMGIPGLADYCASKAALRLAGMSLAAEFRQQGRRAAVFSYEPGVVETDMQTIARSADPARFPSWQTFADFAEHGDLAAPAAVVNPIIEFLVSTVVASFSEQRFGADQS